MSALLCRPPSFYQLTSWVPWWIVVTGILGVVVLLRVGRNLRAGRKTPAPLPPGPKGLPILGNLFQIPIHQPWKVYHSWKETYESVELKDQIQGDIIYLEALGQRILVLNSLASIEALLVKRAANYSDRAGSVITDLMRFGWLFGLMNYGSEWRERRRVFHQFFNHSEQHHPLIEHEIGNFLRQLTKRPTGYKEEVRTMLGTLIMRLTYGAEDNEYNKRLIHAASAVAIGFTKYSVPGELLVTSFPLLRYVPSWFPGAGWKSKLEELAVINDYIHGQPFDDAIERAKSGKREEFPSFMSNVLQTLPPEEDPERPRQEGVARDVAAGAYAGGCRSIPLHAPEWLIVSVDNAIASSANVLAVALALHPDVQEKAQAEIDAVVGSDRLPEFSDLDHLPYIQAIVKEFSPERFLENEKLNPSVLDPEVAIFGYGRRVCPGRQLGNDILTILAARLLACFNVKQAFDEAGNPKPISAEMTSTFISLVFRLVQAAIETDLRSGVGRPCRLIAMLYLALQAI
ncbi:O-methylsterigmatocystin oxidoreductase [Coprinopsis cinerea okayama7|uniref:O-methylsterigmatocystin oxidoreductase n=1 Tax=Coprinopsis cinerea (strain Okayama-7 / 130 / ATCC MYA-4618 / FGSC 9003) TaxID=240176 RepID=D6RPT3_COPC7|nr:O-methylsterigmatocystin oxidoreductase [Coprinopsis cinerea okayama7\|eukprot:XP_002910527.1 O-methylsterigmatocystin oxidoreductase [Coprinopsis cinerea okayama7\